MIKAVLFDLDNTLVDFMTMKREATRAAAYAMVGAGLKADRDELAGKLFDYYLRYNIESDDAFQNYMMKEYRRIDYRALGAGVNAYLAEKGKHMKPYPGVVETLAELRRRGLKLAVVSDGVRLKAWMRLNAAGLDGFFDAVVTPEDTGKRKPAKEPFLKACEILKVRPEECLMVGDWPERDIAGAKAAGMRTCWAKYGSSAAEAGADFVLDDFKLLPGLLEPAYI
jgi:HAD superfamily hydrolase (TIGR02253 family)